MFCICRFCGDRGCLACAGERAKIKPPEPVFVAHFDNPTEMDALKEIAHRDVITKIFGPSGGGHDEWMRLVKDVKGRLRSDQNKE